MKAIRDLLMATGPELWEYVEELERIVLASWQYDSYLCRACGASRFKDGQELPQWHEPDCLIPDLIAMKAETRHQIPADPQW